MFILDYVFNIFQDWVTQYYLSKGVPPSMINLGMPVYGRSFTLQDRNNHDLQAPTRGAGNSGRYTNEAGFLSYYEVII